MSFDRPHDDFDARPRRRDRGSDDDGGDYDDFYGDTAADARARVAVPAVILIVCSVLALLASLGIVGLGVFLAFFAPPAGPNGGAELKILGAVYGGGGLVAAVYSVVMMFAAIRMKQLRSYGFAFAGAIMAIASAFCMSLLGFIIMPFGIWALVVLCNADVKREFDQNRPRARHDGDFD